MPSTSEDASAGRALGGSLKSARGQFSKGLERLTEWTILLPVLLIGGALVFFGFKWVYLGALIAGVVVFNFWGRKMAFSDPKLALVVNIEKREVAPLFIGRKRWADAAKVGRPSLAFRTPGGLSVEILSSYDPLTNSAVYPMTDQFSDLMIAAIPERYGELIDEYVKAKKEILIHTSEHEVEAYKIAKKHITDFSALLNEIMSPPEAVQEKAAAAEEVKEGQDVGL